MSEPITILDLAKYRGAKENERGSIDGQAFADVGLEIIGGCCVCHATLAAYNACPSKSGYWKCRSGCIGDDGFESVEEANEILFPPGEYTHLPQDDEDAARYRGQVDEIERRHRELGGPL
jgi:hypothetical protein